MVRRAAYMGMNLGGALPLLLLLWMCACAAEPARLTVGYLPGEGGAGARDAGADAEQDGPQQDAAVPCELPDGVSLPEELSAEVQGDPLAPIVYFAHGEPLPRGRYRASYVGGCFSCCCCITSLDEFWLVGADILSMIAPLPGGYDQTGLDLAPVASCPARGAPYQDLLFDFSGGKLGIWFTDVAAFDDVNESGGPNPTWRLTLLEACP